MADLTDYHVVDGVDDVLAVQYNRIIDSTVRGELSNIESLTANKTLTDADFALQIFTPTAARDVTLPAIVAANHPFYIVNASASYALTVKNAGGTTIGTVAVSSSGSFASDGVAWHSFGGGGVAKAAYTDVATGTDDTKYVTSAAIKNSVNVPNVAPSTAGNVLTSDGSAWVSTAQNGWASVAWATLTRTGDQTFTTTTNVTAILAVGCRLKFTDTTTKYAVVASVSAYTGGVTTITIVANTDYKFVGHPSAMSYSFHEAPQGWPVWFNYTCTTAGLTMGNGTLVAKYKISNKITTVAVNFTLGSTSAVTGNVTFSVPISSVTSSMLSAWLQDAGTNTYGGLITIYSTTATAYAINTAGTYMAVATLSSTVPFTWAIGDFISFIASYDMA